MKYRVAPLYNACSLFSRSSLSQHLCSVFSALAHYENYYLKKKKSHRFCAVVAFSCITSLLFTISINGISDAATKGLRRKKKQKKTKWNSVQIDANFQSSLPACWTVFFFWFFPIWLIKWCARTLPEIDRIRERPFNRIHRPMKSVTR